MDIRSHRPADLPSDVWDRFVALRDSDPCKDDPLFDPHLVKLMAAVRDDTRVLVAETGGEPVGFWPLQQRPGGWARPLAGPFSDWHAPIRKAGINLSPQAFLAGAGIGGMTTHGFQPCANGPPGEQMERMAANMIDLSMGFEVYLEDQRRQFPKHFKKVRRMMRNAERDFGTVTATLNDTDPAAFDWLITKKRAQFARTGRHDVIAPDWATGFIQACREQPGARFGTSLCTLRFDGRLAAAELNMRSDRVLHGWLTGFEAEFSYYSPGYLLQQAILEMMEPEGLVIYDSGPELDYYKKYYSNYSLPIDRGVIRGKASPVSPSRLLGAGWRGLEHAMPGKAGDVFAKTRRRLDQILISETGFSARAKGVLGALQGSSS